jgi:16S rRNA (guanine966-N2)-methyltransferase
MRIIAGRFKGRVLKNFEASHIRPTTDRVKETLFNILQAHIEGARVLDIFAGTGNLSIEALSRGAAVVECVEKHPTSIKIIFENLKMIKIEKEIKVHKEDAFLFMKKYDGDPFDVIFIDPPFTEQLADSIMTEIEKTRLFHSETIFAIESAKKEKLLKKYGRLEAIDTRLFGDKVLTLFKETVK